MSLQNATYDTVSDKRYGGDRRDNVSDDVLKADTD